MNKNSVAGRALWARFVIGFMAAGFAAGAAAAAHADGAAQHVQAVQGTASPGGAALGPAAAMVQAYFDALGGPQPDYIAAQKMQVQSPSLKDAMVQRYMKIFARFVRTNHPRILAEHAIDDCAVVMFLRSGAGPERAEHAWLIRQGGTWRVSPRVTDWTVISDVLNEEQRVRMRKLSDWVSQFHSRSQGASRNVTPDSGTAPAEQQVTGNPPAPGKVDSAEPPAGNPLAAAAQAHSATVQAEAVQRKKEDQAVHERLETELQAYDAYLQALGEEVFQRASHNYALDNFFDPGKIALLSVRQHLQAQQDPRLESDDPAERLEAQNEVRAWEQKAHALDSAYVQALMLDIDFADAIAPERIRRWGESEARDVLYLDVARGEITQARLDGIGDCVGASMVQSFEELPSASMDFINRKFQGYLSACRADPHPVAAQATEPVPAQASQTTIAKAQQQEGAAAAEDEEQASPAEEVDHAVEEAKKITNKLGSLFDH